MADPARPDLPPARPPSPKPLSVRDVTGEVPAQQAAPDLDEAQIEVADERWTVRVLGRAGRASGASPPLLLLGFWRPESSDPTPALEAMVVSSALGNLSEEALAEALSRAGPPRDPDRRPPFFRDGSQGRRRRPNENI